MSAVADQPLPPAELEAQLRALGGATAPWEQALSLCDGLLAHGRRRAAAMWLDALPGRLPPPGPTVKADLVLRRLQLDGPEVEPLVQEAALREALALDPTHPTALATLADLLLRLGRTTEAVRLCRTLFAHHKESLPGPLRARAYTALAQARLLDEGQEPATLRRARVDLDKALEAAPDFAPALRLLADVCFAGGQGAEAVAALRAGARRAPDAVGALVEAADELRQRRGLPGPAEELLLEAQALDGADQRPLRALLAVHRAAEDWEALVRDLVAAAERLPGEAGRPERAAAYLTMGQLYQQRLSDPAAALACYLQALELDPTLHDAFLRASSLLAENEDWPGLEQQTARLLQRLGTTAPRERRAALHALLGRLHQQRLQQPGAALAAFEAALALTPEDPELLEAIAGLDEAHAVLDHRRRRRLHRTLLVRQPERVASLHALRLACFEQGSLDEAWCLAARLVADGTATPPEAAFFHNLQRAEPPAVGALPAEVWARELRHPTQRPELFALLALVAPTLQPLFSVSPRDYELRAKEGIAADAPLPVNRALQRVTGALGLATPPPVYRSARPGCALLPTAPPVLLLGEDQLVGHTPTQLVVALARELVALGGGDWLVARLDPPALRWLLQLLLSYGGAGPHPGPSAESERVEAALRQGLDARQHETLRTLAGELATLERSQADGSGYRRALQASGARLALLLTEDLPAVVAGQDDPWVVEELRRFAIGPTYLRLRHQLGLGFDEGGDEELPGEPHDATR